MRRTALTARVLAPLLLVAASACSIPDKQAAAPDAGPSDAGVDAPPVVGGPLDTRITSAPAEFTRQGLAVFEFTADRSDVTYSCSIDGETAINCTSPYSRSLGDGPHTFSVRAATVAGETEDTPAEHLWTVDTVPPETRLTAAPPAADNSTTVRFEFTSPEANVVFECSLDGSAYLPCMSGDSFGPLADGTHSFAVRAKDRAGNVDTSPSIHAWSVNTSTPDTQILSAPSGAIATTSATITFLSPDAGAGATFQCSLDGAAFAACTSPHTVTGLADGDHTFAVRVRDSVGNVDPTPAMRTWRVDHTPPETTITSGPTGTIAAASASFAFASNEADATFLCSLDGAAATACASPASYTMLAQGGHTFAVHAVDAAGTPDASPATRMWTVDTVAPLVSITNGPAAGSSVGPRIALAFMANEGTVVCSLDGAAFAPCTSPIATNLAAGAHSFAVRATDAAGNAATAMRAWTVVCGAPTVAGAAGLLHFDDGTQLQPNAVAGGANATLGDTEMAEATDPQSVGGGRYGKALRFDATAGGDHVAWPVALGAAPALAFELWAKPTLTNPGEVLATGDGRIVLAASPLGATTMRFSITVGSFVATSGAVTMGAWHHVAVSLGASSLSLYVDGVRTDATGVAIATPPALDAVRIGGTGATTYDGLVDEVWLATSMFASDDAALANYCPL